MYFRPLKGAPYITPFIKIGLETHTVVSGPPLQTQGRTHFSSVESHFSARGQSVLATFVFELLAILDVALLGGSSQFVVVNNQWLVSPLSRVVPLPNGLNGIYMGVTNHLLTGMILRVRIQVCPQFGFP